MENILFVLGADDPEMKKIVSFLEILHYNYTFASVSDKRCNSSNSYSAEFFNFFYETIIYIECNTIEKLHSNKTILIDHHNDGDFGHSLSYDRFLEASSIGQFLKFVLNNDFDYVVNVLGFDMTPSNSFEKNTTFFKDNNWFISVNDFSVRIPKDVVLIAGIDHCPSAVYSGLCKGIEVDDLFQLRVLAIAKDLSISLSEISVVLEKYTNIIKKILMADEENGIFDLTHIDLGVGFYSPDYLILRELAISNQMPIAVKTKNTDDAELYKIMFLSLDENQVKDILNIKKFKSCNLEDVFGVPSRGYAGGFVGKNKLSL